MKNFKKSTIISITIKKKIQLHHILGIQIKNIATLNLRIMHITREIIDIETHKTIKKTLLTIIKEAIISNPMTHMFLFNQKINL
jgi:hypothetical protein